MNGAGQGGEQLLKSWEYKNLQFLADCFLQVLQLLKSWEYKNRLDLRYARLQSFTVT